MFDIAYIIMDLDARDRSDLSNGFLNAYAEQTGDWEGLQVLPLYLSRQSYVRAKVTSFLLDDPSVPEAVKAQSAETASRYYRLAWDYTKPRQGNLTLMSGLSGSGKSTVARQLAQKTGAIHIRSDAVRKHLAGVSLDERGGDELYTPEMTQNLRSSSGIGHSFDTAGVFRYSGCQIRSTAASASCNRPSSGSQSAPKIVYCTAPVPVLEERLRDRTGDVSDATADLLPEQHMDPFSDVEQPYLITLDTTRNLETQLKEF